LHRIIMDSEEFKDANPEMNLSSSNNGNPSKSKQKADKDASVLLQKQQYEMMIKTALTERELKQSAVKDSYPKIKAPSTLDRSTRDAVFGLVRGTPYGACLTSETESKEEATSRGNKWNEWREKNFDPLHFPVEGFDHIYGKEDIDIQEDYGAEAAAMAAQLGPDAGMDEVDPEAGREYGSSRTTLDAPIGSLKDKWRVLPHFLQVRSLMRQHIDSFDYFVNTEMKEIVQSPSACEIRSEHDPKFYLRYTDCWVGEPSVEEDSHATSQATPNQCRLRDCTYSAPIYVNIRYTRGRQIVIKKKVGFLPGWRQSGNH
jgi:hypothetical protein